MGSKIDGPSGHFQRGIGHYTWLACKTDISEEVRSHQSNVISRLFVSLDHPQTNSGPLIPLHSYCIQRSQIPLLWTDFGHQSASICGFRKNFLSPRMLVSIDPKAQITYMGSKIDCTSGPRPRFFIAGLGHFQRGIGYYTWLACKTDISEEVRSHLSNVITRLFVVPRPPTD